MKKLIFSTILLVLSTIGFSQCQLPTNVNVTLTFNNTTHLVGENPNNNGISAEWDNSNNGKDYNVSVTQNINTVKITGTSTSATYEIGDFTNLQPNYNNGTKRWQTLIISGNFHFKNQFYLRDNQKIYILSGSTVTFDNIGLREGAQIFTSGTLKFSNFVTVNDNGTDDATHDWLDHSTITVAGTSGLLTIVNGSTTKNYTTATITAQNNYFDDDPYSTDRVYLGECNNALPIHFTSFTAKAAPNKTDIIVEFTYDIADGTTEKYVDIRFSIDNGATFKTKRIESSTLNPSGKNTFTITKSELNN